MLVKLGDIKGLLDGLSQLTSQKLPIRLSYKISKLIKQLMGEYKDFEEARITICQKYCNRDEKGNPIMINNTFTFNENINLINEMNELLNIDLNIDFSPLLLSELEENNIKLSPQELTGLDKIIEG